MISFAERQLAYQAHLLDNVSDAIIATDDQLILTAWNRAAEKMYGLKAGQVLGKKMREVVRSDFIAERRAEALRALWDTEYYRDGYQVGNAETGDATLAYTARQSPDLVLLDIGLPDSDGLNIGRAIRRNRPMPIIFLTGRSGEIDKASAMALGDDYVTKPFSMTEREARVEMVRRRVRQTSQSAPPEIIEITCGYKLLTRVWA